MLFIGGVIICFALSRPFTTPPRLGMFSAFVATVAAVLLILPGFPYLVLGMFMQPGQIWPMAILLPFAVLHVLVGGIGLWMVVRSQDVSVWFAWPLIVYTAVPAILVVVLIRAMRDVRQLADRPGGFEVLPASGEPNPPPH